MLVIAYYTAGSPYEGEAQLLRKSLRACRMQFEIAKLPPARDWYDATMQKPMFIDSVMSSVSEDLLYIDVDAYVHRNCEEYFNGLDCDLGVHYFQGPRKGFHEGEVSNRLLSGTMFFRYTMWSKRLIDAWCSLNKLLADNYITAGGGQKNLWYLTTCMKDLRIANIGGEYCYVFDKPWAYPPNCVPVIEHTIASRENRDPSREKDRARRRRKSELMAL